MSFQIQVQLQQAPAVEGDFASTNPMVSLLAWEGALQAAANTLNGDAGVRLARFGWVTTDSNGEPSTVANFGQGAPDGFVHREGNALITTYLDESGMVVPAGFAMTLAKKGDFWVKTNSNATRKQKVFASLIDGSAKAADAGSTIAGFSGTATFATDVMTVASVVSGTVEVNSVVTSAGVDVGTYVTAQLTGTPGGVGTYSLSTTPGTITPAQAVTTTDYVETDYVAQTSASSGELIKMSNW